MEGWVKKGEIEILPTVDSEPLSAWVGKWSLHESEIEITQNKDDTSLQVTGTAIWTGGKDRNGNLIAHTGDLDGTAVPSKNTLLLGNVADLKAYTADCAATLKLLGDALIVHDNRNCGGMNVTFDGVYYR